MLFQPLLTALMVLRNRKYFLLLLCLTDLCLQSTARNIPVLQMVNPFIGTSNTRTPSLWGCEGGTYPGAVAPFGFVQLTPETRKGDSNGYNYLDTTICYFSCINHPTGYPDGSSGMIRILPVEADRDIQTGKYSRSFSHQDEKAAPGYYSVLFRDNGTLVEATAAEHSGMFRFTFPPHLKPRIFLSDLGKVETVSKKVLYGSTCHTILSFNVGFIDCEEISGGCILTFPPVEKGKSVLILKIGVSLVDFESTRNNLKGEADELSFDQFKAQNQLKWKKALSVITVEDSSAINKTIFYTALYHSMLMPWIISDVRGNYKGADGQIHKTKGKNQYGGFSAWDTFRTLHPLLCLIAADRQRDMILSMLDEFEQSGSLPIGPMTGNHVIEIIVDSYLKGIMGFDKILAYNAMKACLASSPGSREFAAYQKLGYVPYSFSESVTKTVEFAYDDWVLAQFAGKVMDDQDEYNKLLKRSFNYRNHFNVEAMALVPRQGDNFNQYPGYSGYKEGDQWSYSMFVPQNPLDLINFFGGDNAFSEHLDSALEKQYILFDNEPVLHVPYLFNYANRPDLTQKWVRNLMMTHYTMTPWGLPGNDDHGAMSGWYVFSALGLYPLCPGRALYDFGSPLFEKVTIHLQNRKQWMINSKNNGEDRLFVKSTSLNGQSYTKSWISHSTIIRGGELTFEMDKLSGEDSVRTPVFAAPSETLNRPDFKIIGLHLSQKQVVPDQLFFVHFTVQNKGSKGTKIARLLIDGKEYAKKNLLIDENTVKADSVGCRLYPVGNHKIDMDNLYNLSIVVVPSRGNLYPPIQVIGLKSRTIFKKNEPNDYSCWLQNKSGFRVGETISAFGDDTLLQKVNVSLEPGEIKKIEGTILFKNGGIHSLRVGSKFKRIKIYDKNVDSKVIDLSMGMKLTSDTIVDQSGLSNNCLIHKKLSGISRSLNAIQTDSVCFARIPKAESLDNLDQKITVMAWVKPNGENSGLADIITKGDFIALQAAGNKSLSWFAGGWGRGSCSADLPGNWINNWHHIAGVSDGKRLKIYIDGIESGSFTTDIPVNLSCEATWMLGRNEEFPEQRFFNGFIDHFKIFVEPLTGEEIRAEMQIGTPKREN